MIRKAMLSLGVLALLAPAALAQKNCATDEIYRAQKARNPQIQVEENKLEAEISRQMHGGRVSNPRAKTTDIADTAWMYDTQEFHIPVVVHVIYDYAIPGADVVTDNDIFAMMGRLNNYYHANTQDTAGIIAPFKKYIGNAHINFHLATKDPNGKPTRGIVRTFSYLSNGGDNAAKINPWAPDRYLNIYLENVIGKTNPGGVVLAYATFPTTYSDNPYEQGVISRADQVTRLSSDAATTMAHEIGHFLFLYHTWNTNNAGAGSTTAPCGDDEVDDTPPTVGHTSCGFTQLYDTKCATGYKKKYDSLTYYKITGLRTDTGGIIDYPDTTNTQNIMDYSSCTSQMFTKGQVARMRASLRSGVGSRNNLVSDTNLFITGVRDYNGTFFPVPKVKPSADFSINRPYVCADESTTVTFTSRSYASNVGSTEWSFSSSATTTAASTPSVSNTFSKEGWVDATYIIGASDIPNAYDTVKRTLVYAADNTPKNPVGYFQDFNPDGDRSHWPLFNYYNSTENKWEYVDYAGVYDHTSIRFKNYDTRILTSNAITSSPDGLYGDFYTPFFDLSSFSNCNIDFFSSGAWRTSKPSEMNDTLFVDMSNDCGASWIPVMDPSTARRTAITGNDLGNRSYRIDNFVPIWSDWIEHSIKINPVQLSASSKIAFRFRFKVGTNVPNSYSSFTDNIYGSGNNFYIDRIRITSDALGVSGGAIVNLGLNVSPNPTNGAATVRINGGDNTVADVVVTDVTGKLVWSTSVKRTAATTRIEIPATAIAAKGMYLVKVVTGAATATQKLVVY